MRQRRILLFFLGFFALLVVATYVVLVHTGASRALVENVMSKFIRGRFGLEDAEVDPTTGTVRIEGVHIDHPTVAERRILDVDHIELEVSTNPLGSDGIGTVQRVKIEKLNLDVSFTEGERWDLMEILHLPEPSDEPDNYPSILISDSTVTVRLSSERPEVKFTAVELQLLPEEIGSPRVVLTGSMTTPAGFNVTVRGSGDLSKGEFHALFETENLPLLPKVARPYSLEAERFLEDAHLSGLAKKVTLWLQYPPEPGDVSDITARLNAEVEDVAATPREFPYPFVSADGKVTASTRDGGRIHFDLLSENQGRHIRARGDVTRCLFGPPLARMLIKGHGIEIDDHLAKAVRTVPVGRDVWDALQPADGSAEFEVFLYNDDEGGPLQLSMDLMLHDAGATFAGFTPAEGERRVSFPYLLENINGTVQVREGEVLLKDVTAERSDGGRFAISGSVAGLDDGSGGDFQIEIDSKSLAFSDELRAGIDALFVGGAEVYDSYSPEGSADAEIWVRKRPGDSAPRFHVAIAPLGASASYRLFPYRLQDLRGRIEIGSSNISFDVSGTRGNTTADISGRFFLDTDQEAGLRSELWLQARSVVIDDSLRDAVKVLNPDLESLWTSWDPTGELNCQLTMWKTAGADAFQHDLRLDFLSGSANVRRFDERLHNLNGSVFVNGTGPRNRVDINLLRGEVHNGGEATNASVLLEGTIDYTEAGDAIEMTTILRGLELNAELARTLDYAKILSQSSWDVLSPSGFVDVVCHHSKPPDGADMDHHLRVQLRDVRSDAYFLPYPATKLNGEVTVHRDVSEFTEIGGLVGTAQVFVRGGKIEHLADRTVIESTIAADHLPVDENFSNLMRGPLQKVFIERQVRGTLEIPGLAMRFELPDEGDRFELQLSGPVIAKNLRMMLVVPIEEISGTFTFAESRIQPDDGYVQCDGKDVALRITGHRATEVQGRLTAFPSSIRLDELRVNMHNGRLSSDGKDDRAITYDWEKQELSAQLRWEDMSLSQLMRAAGDPSPNLRGTMSGRIDLERLVGTDMVDMSAKGSLEIRNGQLGEVPIFTAIYAFLSAENRPQFDGVRIDLDYRDRQIEIETLSVTSPLVEITGQGVIGLDGYVDIVLEFPDFFASASSWLFLPKVLQVITTPLVRFHVFGYMRNPHARPRWLFQQDPTRVGIDPIPAKTQPRPKKPF